MQNGCLTPDDDIIKREFQLLKKREQQKKDVPVNIAKAISYSVIMGGASLVGADLFWDRVILPPLISNNHYRQLGAHGAGAFFFFATAALVGWSYWKSARNDTAENCAFLITSSFFSVCGSIGVILGLNVIVFGADNSFNFQRLFKLQINVIEAITLVATIAYILLAVIQKYMEIYTEVKEKKYKLFQEKMEEKKNEEYYNDYNNDIFNEPIISPYPANNDSNRMLSQYLTKYHNSTSAITLTNLGLCLGDDSSAVEETWKDIIETWNRLGHAEHNVREGKYRGFNRYYFFVMFFRLLNAAIGFVSGFGFAAAVFCSSSLFGQLVCGCISSVLTMFFFSEEISGAAKKYYYLKLEAQNTVVIKQGGLIDKSDQSFENIFTLLKHMIETNSSDELKDKISEFLKDAKNPIYNTLMVDKKKSKSFCSSLGGYTLLAGVSYQFVGMTYLTAGSEIKNPSLKWPLFCLAIAAVIAACYLKKDQDRIDEDNKITSMKKTYFELLECVDSEEDNSGSIGDETYGSASNPSQSPRRAVI